MYIIISSFINYCSSNKKDNDDTDGKKHNDDDNNNDNDNDNDASDEDNEEAGIWQYNRGYKNLKSNNVAIVIVVNRK